jgi:hypothetical protein
MKSVAITVRSYRGWPHDGATLGVLDAHLGKPLDAKKTTSGAVHWAAMISLLILLGIATALVGSPAAVPVRSRLMRRGRPVPT